MIDLEAKLDRLLATRIDLAKVASASAGVRETTESLEKAVAEAT